MSRMRALALHSKAPRNHDVCAPRRAAARAFMSSRSGVPEDESASVRAEPPAETDAWWLSRSQAPTFARRRIALSDELARALRATGDTPLRIAVEFNGAS